MMRFLLFLGIAAAAVLTLIVYACVVAGARSEHELEEMMEREQQAFPPNH